MTTSTIEIKNSIALDLLQSKPAIAGQKLSEKFAGSLSKENYHLLRIILFLLSRCLGK